MALQVIGDPNFWSMREIITLQIGGYANFVGSHLWNFQDELLGLENDPGADPEFHDTGVNFDVLYRVGETQQGIATYTPRLLAIDYQGSLGAQHSAGTLYGKPPSIQTSSVTTWSGEISKHIAEPIKKNAFLQILDNDESERDTKAGFQQGLQQNSAGAGGASQCMKEMERICKQSLEDNVEFWTDYCKAHLHPMSIYQVKGLWHGVTPFDNFGSGRGLLTGLIQEEIQDRIRFFLEECDQLQGLQVLVDDSNGFAGLAADVLEAIVDEYSSNPLLLFSMRSPTTFRKPTDLWSSTVRALHDSISFSKLCSLSRCIIPVGLPSLGKSEACKYLCVDDTKDFHTSAVYAAAISCVTLPFRLKSSGSSAGIQQRCVGGTDMATLLNMLSNPTGRRVSILDAAMPAPRIPSTEIGAFDFTQLQSLTCNLGDSDDREATEALVIQGALKADPPVRASISEVLHCIRRHPEILQQRSLCHLAAFLCPLAIPLPFPNIFGPFVGPNGEILGTSSKSNHERCGSDVCSMPMATKMRMSAAILPYLETRLHYLKHFALSQSSLGGQVLESWGLQKDEVYELYEFLSRNVAAYGGDIGVSSDTDS